MEQFLHSISTKPLKVIDNSIGLLEYIPISISSDNPDLNFDISSSKEWEVYIDSYLKRNNKKVAFGGYLEKRDIYSRSDYFEGNDRNIHLGVDFWCDAGTNVLAVLEGEVHSIGNNQNYGDYGPTLILKHLIEGKEFYSLYGHLSAKSIESLKKGKKVRRGEAIAKLGTSNENGDYAPHLHFQIIIDIENYKGDYPGVCNIHDLDFYKKNCPNPLSLCKL
ncbi:peptidase M23 [Tenacibaculum holothuriorum]|uniref:Peptidase M23 n=1 Tax=Tenacibaculum holothuriorum TaxID=1635173 RepID=A0A1Y2PG80_9FLAO|nr:peptidoglycan DD-metalloendopeptidase family protein [Tenacibaculum holothuriorum]OSY89435.1 peptidase M23 [Tenacibaculum holothuriorum]